jgi:hypothetical protein
MSGTVQPAVSFDDVVSDDAATMIHFEHPALAEEFAAVVVLATLAYAADGTGSALPPLWPMVLHSSFTDLILPVPGADDDASSSDAAPIVRAFPETGAANRQVKLYAEDTNM